MSKLYQETTNAKRFPVSRIGNSKNPRVIILLENSNSDPINLELNPEYTLWLDNKFTPYNRSSHSHMDLTTFIKYDKWWHTLWNYCTEGENPNKLEKDDFLVLEFYPYFTKDDTEKRKRVYNKKNNDWDDFAKQSLEINKKLLESAMKHKIPIFIYYKSGWLDLKDDNGSVILNKDSNKYINFYDFDETSNTSINYRGSKKNKLTSFLTKSIIIEQIEYLRRNNKYKLNS